MAENTWINQVRPGSRPEQDLTGRTDYLRRRLDAAEFGQAVFAHDVTLDPDLLEGQPVYWNDDAQRFEAALAAAEADADSGALVPSASAHVLGVLYAKEFATKGSVLLFGYAPLDLTNSAGAGAAAGLYYLSASEPGKLTRQRPAVSCPVLFCDGAGNAYVRPSDRPFAEDHVHYSFELACRPAGHSDQPDPDGRHAVKSPDVSVRGWLPATHASFRGTAPRRAAFGYNLAAHPELQRVWPPVPVEAVALTWDKGTNALGGTAVPLGTDGLVVVDRYGIWWMSDLYGDAPWPAATNTSLSSYPAEGSYPSSDVTPESPRFERMRLTLSFVRMAYATSRATVTSLRPATASPIRFVDCDGNEATTGDLFARFAEDFLVEDNTTDGSLVLKELSGNRFKRGPVVEGVRSTSANLEVSGSRTKEIDGETYQQGLLALTVNLDPAARDLPVQLVRLDDVKERVYQDVLYLGMPADTESSIRARLKVPGAGLPADPRVKLRVQLLGRAAGTVPTLTASYRLVPRPTGAAALPTADTALALATGQTVAADEYVESESDPIAVAAGDTLLFTIARADDAYSGELGLLDVTGVLYAG